MAEGYYREVAAGLRENNYAYKENAKGSHEKWVHSPSGRVVIVPKNLKSRRTLLRRRAEAVLELIRRVGDDPKRAGPVDTPRRNGSH